jgi:hypothetical protein
LRLCEIKNKSYAYVFCTQIWQILADLILKWICANLLKSILNLREILTTSQNLLNLPNLREKINRKAVNLLIIKICGKKKRAKDNLARLKERV